MTDSHTTRRAVLRGAAAGSLAAVAVGEVAAEGGSGGGGRPPAWIVGTASRAAEREARRRADSVRRVLDFGAIGKAVAGRFSDRAVRELRKHDDVRYVEEDGTWHAIAVDSDDPEVPWGIDRVDAEKAHDDGATGNGADVSIIDTGIDSNHPDLQANLGAGKAVVSSRGPYTEAWDDDNGHGTHCAGIADAVDDDAGVVGVSTEATLHAVKVLDKNGSGSWSDVAAGIEWVADRGHDVGSLSLGGSSGSRTVKDACQYADGKGVLLVAAAGNGGPCSDCVGYPAAYEECVAVSSTDNDDALSSFSSTGPEVELAAPGGEIYSTYAGSGYETLSGTSMACPHVSGAGGQLMAQGYGHEEARTRLADTAEDVGLSSSEQGAGLLDVEAAVSGSVDAAPSVSWVTPTDGDTVGGTVTVQIDASDGEDSDDSLDVTYAVDGGSSRSTTYDSTSGYYEDSWDTTGVADGDHTLEASATDSAGNTTTSTITVATENTDDAPSVSWVNPSDGETVGGSVAIELDAGDDRDDGSDITVEWQVDDGTWRTASYDSTSGNYEDSWDSTTVADGDHALDARATDTAGYTSSEARVGVTVSNTSSAPTVDGLSLSEDNHGGSPHADFDVSWSVSDDDGDLDAVELTLTDLDDGEVEDSATVDVDGGSASGTTDLSAKHEENSGHTYEVELVVSDASGDTASATEAEVEDGS